MTAADEERRKIAMDLIDKWAVNSRDELEFSARDCYRLQDAITRELAAAERRRMENLGKICDQAEFTAGTVKAFCAPEYYAGWQACAKFFGDVIRAAVGERE